MSRLSLGAFAALVVATVAAFFVTQHLKSSTPLIAGLPKPSPSVISPEGRGCGGTHRGTHVSFYLLHRADDVAVYVVDPSGTIVRTLVSSRHMRRGVRNPDGEFFWDGRTDGGAVAADGTYYLRVVLLGQGRTIELANPVTVQSSAPRPMITDVTPAVISRPGMAATIRIAGNDRRGGLVSLYRTDLPGKVRLVKSFGAPWGRTTVRWDGRVHGRPAPAGTYLVGLTVTDRACNVGRFPMRIPPPPGSTPRAGVTVRYLAAQPPLHAVLAGRTATVRVDAGGQPYSWTLTRVGVRKPAASGHAQGSALSVPVPAGRSGLYVLSLRAAHLLASVPVLVSARTAPGAGTLVVLPALTWQGLDPVDDTGDGVPDTLPAGGPITLDRVLAQGLPKGFASEAQLLSQLDSAHVPYELTTDLGLIDGVPPSLSRRQVVVLAGSERWLTAALGRRLRAFVAGGGHLLSLGLDSLRREVTVGGGKATDPRPPSPTDIFGVRPGAVLAADPDVDVSYGRGAVAEFNPVASGAAAQLVSQLQQVLGR